LVGIGKDGPRWDFRRINPERVSKSSRWPQMGRGAGGPTSLILSASLADCRHPPIIYHLAQPERK
jgi:hypothetical protein